MSLAPLSLADAPAFIERQFPVGRLSAEAYKERKAVSGQTLTALGSYWKGRKPLILCRAVTLGCLLPATADPVADLASFLALMAMDDAAFGRRWDDNAAAFARAFPAHAAELTEPKGKGLRWRPDILEPTRRQRIAEALATLPYAERVRIVRRPEECDQAALLGPVWPAVNAHLGTSAASLPELVEQLGIARFGHRPRVADTFCGGGSIPFEAARIGCDVYASDLNPIACMLTWGAFNIIGASPERRAEIARAQAEVAAQVDAEITAMGIEHDTHGNRAKVFFYCVETRCPKTGWLVPLLPTMMISHGYSVVAQLSPDHANKRYDIMIKSDASELELIDAELGTVRGGRLVHPMNPDRSGVEVKVIRGDRPGGGNALRQWSLADFVPRADDIWQERLYCVQWTRNPALAALDSDPAASKEPKTFFAAVGPGDRAREVRVEAHVAAHLGEWQRAGLVPDMAIKPGANTSQPIWERGWTHWHHLLGPRQLLLLALFASRGRLPQDAISLCQLLNWSSRLSVWNNQGGGGGIVQQTFINQALNTVLNFGCRAFSYLDSFVEPNYKSFPLAVNRSIQCQPAKAFEQLADIFITDPPYADAVNYHEITEIFIAWFEKAAPAPFDQWYWNSNRANAIKGSDAIFRRSMVEVYRNLAHLMPANGYQVVMFTHTDSAVWADLAGIMWAAGLRVASAWTIVTEREGAMRDGNYVQGTVNLVLRKREAGGNANRMDIEGEIEDAVKAQLAALGALDQGWTSATGGETLYTDGDLTLAAYAAALTVVTGYATIDRRDVGADVFREVAKKERTALRQLIDYAAAVANRELVPRDFAKSAWRDLDPASRFYVRMLDMEDRGSPKVADFQNFAKSFALRDYTRLMASNVANAAALAGAADLKGTAIRDTDLTPQPLFQLLFALWKTIEKGDPKIGVQQLRNVTVFDFWQRQRVLADLARYIALKTRHTRADESRWAEELAQAIDAARL